MLAAGLEEKIKLVLDNHDEFDAGLLRLADEAKRLLARETELINRMRARVLMNRRIVNVLTACRLYLDQSSHTISELFGDKSNEVSAAKQRRKAAYNRNLSYRFVEALRNHVQHRGLLVQCLSFRHRHERGDVRFTVEPRLKLSELEEDSEFERSVLEEVKAASSRGPDGGEVDLHKPIKEYLAAIWSLHVRMRRQSLMDAPIAFRSTVLSSNSTNDVMERGSFFRGPLSWMETDDRSLKHFCWRIYVKYIRSTAERRTITSKETSTSNYQRNGRVNETHFPSGNHASVGRGA